MRSNEYEYIVTIAEERNLLRAAEKLYISPSALSQYVAKLENEISTPLFIRSRQGWIPTGAGQIYIDMARNILQEQRRAYAEIGQISSTARSSLTIGISSGLPAEMLASLLPKFNAHFPNVKVFLIESLIQDVIAQIKQNKLDLGFVNSAFSLQGIKVEQINTESFIIIVPRVHLAASSAHTAAGSLSRAAVPLGKFRDCEFMMMKTGTTLRKAEDELFREAGFEPKVVFESSSTQMLFSLARNGYAAAVLPSSYANISSAAISIFLDTPLTWNRYTGYHTGHKLSPAERDIILLARNYYRDLHDQQR